MTLDPGVETFLEYNPQRFTQAQDQTDRRGVVVYVVVPVVRDQGQVQIP